MVSFDGDVDLLGGLNSPHDVEQVAGIHIAHFEADLLDDRTGVQGSSFR